MSKEFDRMHFSMLGGELLWKTKIEIAADKIANNGYVRCKDEFAVHGEGGEYYVYLWKHMSGKVFYIGKGSGTRWLSKRRKNDFFIEQISQGDCVVYKILVDVDEATANMYEKYISYLLSESGCSLASKDNNPNFSTKKGIQALRDIYSAAKGSVIAKEVENALTQHILCDCDFSAIEGLAVFKYRYGKTDEWVQGEHEAILK